MKIYLEQSHTDGSHGAARIFKTSDVAASRKAANVIGSVSASGKVTFINTPEAQAIKKKIESFRGTGTKYGFSTIKLNGKPVKGSLYLDLVNPEYIISDEMTESLVESVHTEEQLIQEMAEEQLDEWDYSFSASINRIILSEHSGAIISEEVVGNEIDLAVDVPIKLFGELKPEFGIDVQPVYMNRNAVFDQDKSKIVGEYDPAIHELTFTDAEFVDKIKTLVSVGYKYEFFLDKMIKRDGFFVSTESGLWNIVKHFQIEDDEEYKDGVYAGFLNDEDAEEVEDVSEATIQTDGITGETDIPKKKSVLDEYIEDIQKATKPTETMKENKNSAMAAYVAAALRY